MPRNIFSENKPPVPLEPPSKGLDLNVGRSNTGVLTPRPQLGEGERPSLIPPSKGLDLNVGREKPIQPPVEAPAPIEQMPQPQPQVQMSTPQDNLTRFRELYPDLSPNIEKGLNAPIESLRRSSQEIVDNAIKGDPKTLAMLQGQRDANLGNEIMEDPFGALYKNTFGEIGTDLAAFGIGWKIGGKVGDGVAQFMPHPLAKAGVKLGSKALVSGIMYAWNQAARRFFAGKREEPGLLSELDVDLGSYTKPETEKSFGRLFAEDVGESSAFILGPAGLGKAGGAIKATNTYRQTMPIIKSALQEVLGPAKKAVNLHVEYITRPIYDNLVVKAARNLRIIPSWEERYEMGEVMKSNPNSRIGATWKSLADVLEPAIERLDPIVRSLFRNPNVMKSHLNSLGISLAEDLAKVQANPLVRLEVSKGLRGTAISDLTTQEAKDILTKFNSNLGKLNLASKYEMSFREEVSKRIGKNLSKEEMIYASPDFQNLISPIAQKAVGAPEARIRDIFTPKTIFGKKIRDANKVEIMQEGLLDIYKNPNFSQDIRRASLDLHNLAATLPEDVAKSSLKVYNTMITDNLTKLRGVVLESEPAVVLKELQATLAKGGLSPQEAASIGRKIEKIKSTEYMPSKWFTKSEGGKGQTSKWVERDVELELRAIQDIPKYANSAFNKYFMGPWKMARIVMRPAAWGRNGITNLLQNHIGGLPMWRVDIYKKAFEGMRGSNYSTVRGKSVGRLYNTWDRVTGGAGTFAMDDVVLLGQGMKEGTGMFDKILNLHNKVANPAKQFYAAQEQFFKFSKFLHNIEKGMGEKEAAWDAMSWTFNYGEVTRATAFTRSTVAPFFTWQSKVFPQFIRAAVENPVQFTGALYLLQNLQTKALEQAGMSESEWTQFKPMMASWLNNGLMFPLPWRDEQNRLQLLDLTYIVPGIGDAVQLSGHPIAQALQNPIISIGGALLNNKKFSGSPIWFEWESPQMKALKACSYTWTQLIPSLVPGPTIAGVETGGIDYQKLYQAFVATPMSEFEPTTRDLNRSQAVLSNLGFKINPVDVDLTRYEFQGRLKSQMAEVKLEFLKKIKKARSSEEKEELLNEMAEYLRKVASQSDSTDEEAGSFPTF